MMLDLDADELRYIILVRPDAPEIGGVRMPATTIAPGDQMSKDPHDHVVLVWNWADSLMKPQVRLLDAGQFSVAAVQPHESPPTLTVDRQELMADGQHVRFRMNGGRRGTLYTVAHQIVTNESPAQEIQRSFFVLVEER
jgi:hypothetical protein